MKKVTIFAVTVLATTLAQGAFAGGDSGFYAGGSVGSAQLSFDALDNYIDDSDTGYKVFGGYNFGILPMVDVAVEASYLDMGTQSGDFLGDKARFSNTALQAHVIGGLNFGPMGLFAKAGVSDWKTKFSYAGESDSVSGSDPAYGIGAKFQVDALQIRAEYEQIQLDDADLDFYSIGAAYSF